MGIKLNVTGLNGLNPKGYYLVTANHQSWADILLMQHLLNRKIPLMKFFLKQELIYVPVIGLCWWALDFPFMKRHSKAYLKKHPEKHGKDLESTLKACEKFKTMPVSIVNYLEGTRFTEAKHNKQQSPFKHLLKPRAGGISYVIGALGEQVRTLLNITIVYHQETSLDSGTYCVDESTVSVSTLNSKPFLHPLQVATTSRTPIFATIFRHGLTSCGKIRIN